MDFNDTDTQQAIRELAGRIFSDRASDDALAALAQQGETYDEALWQVLARQGILGTAIPESAGGSGLGFPELCRVLEEQGRTVAPVPLFSNLVLGGLAIAEFGSGTQQEQYLVPLARGEAKFSAAIADLGLDPAVATAVTAAEDGAGWRLSGEKAMVPDGGAADYILCPCRMAGGGESLFIVDTSAEGVTTRAVEIGVSGERAAHLELDRVSVTPDCLLGDAGAGGDIVQWLEQRADVGHCALQVGLAGEAMKRTADYVSERKQFGVQLGSFQALAMRLADGYIDVEAMRSTYWLALWRLSQGLDARAEVRIAKWWACEGSHRVVCTAQHLHGGIGADLEFPIHRFYLLSKQISFSLGNARRQLQQLGQLLASDEQLGLGALKV